MVEIFGLETAVAWLPVFIRTFFLVNAVPIFSSAVVPRLVRAGLSFWISIAIFEGLRAKYGKEIPPVEIPTDLANSVAGILGEIILASALALLLRIFFVPAQFGGELSGFQIGYGIQTAVQPTAEVPLTLIADFLYLFALLLFLSLDLHMQYIFGINASFDFVPPFWVVWKDSIFDIEAKSFSYALVTAVKIALPFTVAMFAIEVAVALVSRSVPQFNIFVVGFPIRIILGILLIAFTLDRLTLVLADWLPESIKAFSELLKALKTEVPAQ